MKRSRGLLAGHAIRVVKLTALVLALAPGPGRAPAADLYVVTNGAGPDGLTWATATNSIQDAIDAISGIYRTNTVWVSNGVYEVGGATNYPTGATLTNRVAIWQAITVRSANNDPTNTIIKGAWASDGNTNGVDAVRCVYMTNGSSLIGFMLTNGATFAYSASDTTNDRGGGIWCQSTNTVISNCVIAGNAAGFDGGGTFQGTLYNCTLIGNKQCRGNAGGGGGAFMGTLYDCTLTGNWGYSGGASTCIMSNCLLIGNSGGTGGGNRGGTLYNCTLVNNSAINGGGTYQGTLHNCILSSNSSSSTSSGYGGGGANLATLYNCLIVSNSAGRDGGGTLNGTLYNCTIVSNYAGNAGGGVRGSALYNCISWKNQPNADYQPAPLYYSCGVSNANADYTSNNCTTNDPLFVNFAEGNWRLSAHSPSVNTGSNASWMADSTDARSKDLDGRSRIDKFGRRVDMGCYEFLPSGTMLTVR